jgi:8-oxo-dGTP pyrophosphatase MutT (NUDIX family)
MVNSNQQIGRGSEILLVRRDGAIILMQRDDKPGITNPGMITGFGGHAEEGEDPIDTAYREIREETNLEPQKEDLKFFKQYRKTKEVHGEDWDAYYFILHNVDDTKLETYEGQGFVIARDLNEALRFNLSVLMRQVVQDFFSENTRPERSALRQTRYKPSAKPRRV